MCLIVLSYGVHPDFPLVLAANRDEYYQRPSRAAHFWPRFPSILGGQDIEQGGSWLGLHKNGRFAAVTNYRGGSTALAGSRSRGLLVSEYLATKVTARQYLQQCIDNSDDFSAFNLLVGDLDKLYFLSSRERARRQLVPGVHGISNGDLDSDWPKVMAARQGMSAILDAVDADASAEVHEALLTLLADRQLPLDRSLPDTGIGQELERVLAPIFIHGRDYGTRASSVITIDAGQRVKFSERSYDQNAVAVNTLTFDFQVEAHT